MNGRPSFAHLETRPMSNRFASTRGLVWGILLVAIQSSAALALVAPADPSCPGTVNAILGDESFLCATGRLPDASAGEDLRIGIHLAYVEALLRARDVSSWPAAAREARERNLDRLQEYRIAGSFPRHERCPGSRKPVFIDHEGRICAVGYLVEQSVGRALAASIDARFHGATIAEMESEALANWTASSGLSARELAMIQPCYGCPPELECLKLDGRAWLSSPFPGGSINAVAIVDATSFMLDGLQIDGELTMLVGPATYSNQSNYGDHIYYHYYDCAFGIFMDSSSPAIYSPSPPNPVTPGYFMDGEAFLAGGGNLSIYHNRLYESFWLTGEFWIDKGSHQGELVTPYVLLHGPLRPTTDDGYQFILEHATLIGTCGGKPQAVELTSWGRIKANYR
jgi:hypothetical protein